MKMDCGPSPKVMKDISPNKDKVKTKGEGFMSKVLKKK
jgi:hypothetical protein